MTKKLFQLLIGSILSGVVLVGCNNNDDKNAPISDNNIRNDIQNPADNNLRDDNNDNLIDNNNIDDDNVNDYKNDTNTDTDKDPAKDLNTKPEEIIEDDIDRNDRDNRDR